MMVEAKKLGTPLRDAVLAQGINYCLMEGTKHFSVTDGQTGRSTRRTSRCPLTRSESSRST